MNLTITHRVAARLSTLLALSATALAAHASCGASFCTLMTDRFAQGSGEPHVGWSTDVRIERVTQDQLRSGSSNIDASQVTGEEAIERETRNTNLVTTVGYGINGDWSLLLRVPVVRRDHRHDLIDEETGLASTPEQWRFTRLGDVQAIARRQFTLDEGRTSVALLAGSSCRPVRSTSSTTMAAAPSDHCSQVAARLTCCLAWPPGA